MIKKSTDRLDKVEEKLRTGIARDAWKGLNKMMGSSRDRPLSVMTPSLSQTISTHIISDLLNGSLRLSALE